MSDQTFAALRLLASEHPNATVKVDGSFVSADGYYAVTTVDPGHDDYGRWPKALPILIAFKNATPLTLREIVNKLIDLKIDPTDDIKMDVCGLSGQNPEIDDSTTIDGVRFEDGVVYLDSHDDEENLS